MFTEVSSHNARKARIEQIISLMRHTSILVGEPSRNPITLENGELVLPGLGLANDALMLERRAADTEQGLFTILVVGEFKNGKSTLLNAILHEKILPSRHVPATAIITVLVYGKKRDVVVYEKDSIVPRILTREAFNQEFSLSLQDQQTFQAKSFFDRFQNVEFAVLEYEHPLLENGVRLVDSPGLGEHLSRTRVATNFLKRAQAIIFVLSATRILSLDEMTFIQTYLGEGRLNHVFFAVNHINHIDAAEDFHSLDQWIRSKLRQHFLDENGIFDEEFYRRRVRFINAKGALDARTSPVEDEVALKQSGVPELEAEIETFLTSPEKMTALLETNLHIVAHIISEARRKIESDTRMWKEPLEELEEAHTDVTHMLHQLELERSLLEKTILQACERVKRRIYENLIDYVQNMFNTWEEDSGGITLDGIIAPRRLLATIVGGRSREQFQDDAEQQVRQYLTSKLDTWSIQTPQIIENDIQDMISDITIQVGRLEFELEHAQGSLQQGTTDIDFIRERGTQILQDLINSVLYDPSHLGSMIFAQQDWSTLLVRAIADGIVVGLMISFMGGPIGLVGFLALQGFRSAGNQGRMKHELMAKLGQHLQTELSRQLPNHQKELNDHIETQFRNLSQSLTQSMEQRIAETRTTIEKIISQRQKKEFAIEQDLQRLQQIDIQLLHVLSQLYELTYCRKATSTELDALLMNG